MKHVNGLTYEDEELLMWPGPLQGVGGSHRKSLIS
jgi:hypothetical protein